jgi:hypothetical protein
MSDEIEITEEGEEIILSESTGSDEDGNRTIRVYDRARGDFTLEIPKRSTVTFGYFNPAAPRFSPSDGGFRSRPSDVAAATALRIYERGPKSSQLACFLDVSGFRDLSLKLVRLRQRVVIESNFEDDGDGGIESAFKQQKQLNPVLEDEEIPF